MTTLPTDIDGHVMRTPDDWCRIKGIQILDADGWRGYDAKDWDEPLTELDFEERAAVCTQRSVAPQPAGEHHTGTLNLAGEGNAPDGWQTHNRDECTLDRCGIAPGPREATPHGQGNPEPSPISDELADLVLAVKERGVPCPPECDYQTHRRAEVRAQLEAALPALRRQIAEEIAPVLEEFLGGLPGEMAAEITRRLGRGEKL